MRYDYMTSKINHDEKIRSNSSILESIAKQFPKGSPEYEALKTSALAFAYVILYYEREFADYVKDLHTPLTKPNT